MKRPGFKSNGNDDLDLQQQLLRNDHHNVMRSIKRLLDDDDLHQQQRLLESLRLVQFMDLTADAPAAEAIVDIVRLLTNRWKLLLEQLDASPKVSASASCGVPAVHPSTQSEKEIINEANTTTNVVDKDEHLPKKRKIRIIIKPMSQSMPQDAASPKASASTEEDLSSSPPPLRLRVPAVPLTQLEQEFKEAAIYTTADAADIATKKIIQQGPSFLPSSGQEELKAINDDQTNHLPKKMKIRIKIKPAMSTLNNEKPQEAAAALVPLPCNPLPFAPKHSPPPCTPTSTQHHQDKDHQPAEAEDTDEYRDKLELAKRKLRQGYEEAERRKKCRKIKMIKLQDLPMSVRKKLQQHNNHQKKLQQRGCRNRINRFITTRPKHENTVL